MGENGFIRFTGNLDPEAQEFRPAYPVRLQLPFLPPPLPPPPPPFYPEIVYPSLLPPPQTPAAYVSPPPAPAIFSPAIPPPASAPTRALLLSSVPPDVSESEVRRELEVFGDVRAVQMERLREGIVTVHFYDLRAAHAALESVREQHMQHQNRLRIHYTSLLARNNDYFYSGGGGQPPAPPPAVGLVSGHAVWAQFTIPATNAFPDGHNQGTLVIFNLDPNVSAPTLREIFQDFGAVKELRETPMKRQQRFVEFYDVRDAARALMEMNGKDIHGRSVMIEYSRPGGHFCHKKSINYLSRNNMKSLQPPPPPPPSPPLSFRRRTSPRNRRRSSPSSEEESIETAMNRLTLLRKNNVNVNVCRKISSNCNNNNNNNKKGNGGSCSSSSGNNKGRPWKGRQKIFDPRFLIKEEAIMETSNDCKDTRTTVMIKNIPNKYSQKLLLNMLDNHCIHCNEQISDHHPFSSYDFVYLPIDFNNKCNVGYGFVNMTSPEATLRLYKAFHHQHWEVFNSRKICEVTYARVQGLEALKEHFKNSKFACENDEYLPVVFSPPRDGRHLTTPLPIVLTTPSDHDLTLHHHHHHHYVDGGDFTSTSSTTPTTLPSSSDFDHHHDHDHDHDDDVSNDNDDGCDQINLNMNGGGDVTNVDDDEGSSSNTDA